MSNDFDCFIKTFDSPNTVKVVKSLCDIGKYDYSDCTPIDLEQIVLSLKPKSPKSITTICYVLSLYAKYLNNEKLYHMVQDMDRSAIWVIAKPNADKKFISHSRFKSVYHDIGVYEEYNSFYIQTLFRCLYEGIYNDDMSVIKNLRGSDIHGDVVELRDDNGCLYRLKVSEKLARDLVALSNISVWERRNRHGAYEISTKGLYEDTCFKVEIRDGSKENSYRYTYYRILRKVAKEYLEYSLLPLQLYVSGIMYRIDINLREHGISLEDAFAAKNKNRLVNKIISDELIRCNCNTEVKNFREMVRGHIDVFADK